MAALQPARVAMLTRKTALARIRSIKPVLSSLSVKPCVFPSPQVTTQRLAFFTRLYSQAAGSTDDISENTSDFTDIITSVSQLRENALGDTSLRLEESVEMLIAEIAPEGKVEEELKAIQSILVVERNGEDSDVSGPHRWPEWEKLIETLEQNGYAEDKTGPSTQPIERTKQGQQKHTLVNFGKQRDDIFG